MTETRLVLLEIPVETAEPITLYLTATGSGVLVSADQCTLPRGRIGVIVLTAAAEDRLRAETTWRLEAPR